MKCPTCSEEKAKENCCCVCGEEIHADKQKLEPDPFAYDIHGDDRLHLECENCAYQSAMDI